MNLLSVPDDLAAELPAAYVAALESIAAGLSDAEVADRTGVDVSAVPALVRLATARLLTAHAVVSARVTQRTTKDIRFQI